MTQALPLLLAPSQFVKALTNLIAVARREGTQQALASLRHRASERFHEWRFGVQTEGGATPEQLGFTNPACRLYEATDYATLFRLLGALKWHDGRELFIDFGCGKGRVLLMAAMQPVRRVIGVELSPELSATARRNIHRAQPRLRCRDVEVVTCSAEAFVIPPAPLTVFFWNPFAGEILERVLENIHRSYRERPRPIRVIAAYPPGSEFEQRIAAHDWLTVRDSGMLREDVVYRLAEVTGT
jgi:SAM-dependent methyltransferase